MKVATNLSNVVTDITDPAATGASTTPTDYRISKEFRMMQFDGERWRRFGSTMTDDMSTD